MDYSRAQLRKLPPLAGLHEWLKAANAYGSITRQEAVSMVPPLLLGVQPHHRVLDMCAAPGSKTSQLVEALHAGVEPGHLPRGCVLANDSDLQRCNMLVHQLKRAASPGLLVVNHDASHLPGPRCASTRGVAKFDRILADVPCTGDGTLRKAPDMWRKWNIGMGGGMHPLQLAIARRGAQLLRVGGRMAYSTCSMNPVENEAVVAALLRHGGGALRLVDCSAQLPGLRRMPGLSSWKVLDRTGERSSGEAAEGSKQKALAATLFAPSPAEAAWMNLQLCVRILAHHGDTGAFFIALLEKTAELPATEAEAGAPAQGEEEEEEEAAGEGAAAAAAAAAPPAPPVKIERTAQIRCEPVTPVTEEKLIAQISSFYGLSPAFPLAGLLMMRAGDVDGPRPKRLYGVSPDASELLNGDVRRRLKVMSAGVKLFERGHDAACKAAAMEDPDAPLELPARFCPYRVAQDGLRWLLPHISRQLIRVPAVDVARLVRLRTIYFARPDWAAGDEQPTFGEAALAALRDQVLEGCHIMVPVLAGGGAASAVLGGPEDLAVVAWKGRVSVSLLVAKPECVLLLEKLEKFCTAEQVAAMRAEEAGVRVRVAAAAEAKKAALAAGVAPAPGGEEEEAEM